MWCCSPVVLVHACRGHVLRLIAWCKWCCSPVVLAPACRGHVLRLIPFTEPLQVSPQINSSTLIESLKGHSPELAAIVAFSFKYISNNYVLNIIYCLGWHTKHTKKAIFNKKMSLFCKLSCKMFSIVVNNVTWNIYL